MLTYSGLLEQLHTQNVSPDAAEAGIDMELRRFVKLNSHLTAPDAACQVLECLGGTHVQHSKDAA